MPFQLHLVYKTSAIQTDAASLLVAVVKSTIKPLNYDRESRTAFAD